MKVAVYDRYWSTGGGGEKFAAGVAAALADEHDVHLLAHEPVDLTWLGERLLLDLSSVAVDVLDDDLGVTRASAAYDLFVNASYLSWDANRARRGLFIVHFPGPRPGRAEQARRWGVDRSAVPRLRVSGRGASRRRATRCPPGRGSAVRSGTCPGAGRARGSSRRSRSPARTS